MTQEEALKILKTGANVFLTGEPGSGKTYTVNAYVRWLREHGIDPAITASTGIAATHIGGQTIHSWSGIGVRDYLSEYDVEAIANNKNVRRRVKDAHVLILDEVSMLSGSVLSMVDSVMRAVRGNDRPFGGSQVVLVGDFFQLPPVVREGRNSQVFDEDTSPFSFRSTSWRDVNPFICYLEEQHRHQGDALTRALAAIRQGEGRERVHAILQARVVSESGAPSDIPRLFSHNRDVDRINEERLQRMPGTPRAYRMTSRGPDAPVAGLKRGCLSPEELRLKPGAKVMFTKNDPAGKFVNGTLAEVTSIASDGTPTVTTRDGRLLDVEPAEWTLEDGGRVIARITQLPLKLAWAVTVHKSQGMTLDAAVVDLGHAFEYGQGYVAMSRVRSLDGLHLIGYNERALEVHPEVLAHDRTFRERSEGARERFGMMPESEHGSYVHAFIKAGGGNPEGGVTVQKKQKRSAEKGSTQMATLGLVKSRKSVTEIAKARGLKSGTIVDHISDLYMRDLLTKEEVERTVPAALKRALPKIFAAFTRHGTERLTPVHHELKGVYSFDDLKLARLLYTA